MVEAQLQKFSSDQRRTLGNLREELQQQNQALIADISRLLEGFASMVGKVVKGELETAVAQLRLKGNVASSKSQPANISHVSQQPKISDQKSSRTWSKVHQEGPTSQELSSIEDQISLMGLNESPSEKTGKIQRQKGKPKQQKENNGSIKSQPSKKSTSKQQASNGLFTSDASKFSSLDAGIQSEDSNSSSVHFFPEEGPANMLTFDIPHVAQSGKIIKSPVYYLQDCPCKVQLSLWFDTKQKMNMIATLWGLALKPLRKHRVFAFSGGIKNQASQSYSSLFHSESSPFNLKHSSTLSVNLDLSLKTGTGAYCMNLEELENRNYILTNRNSISINWTVTSKEITS